MIGELLSPKKFRLLLKRWRNERSLDINLVTLEQWLAVYEVDFNVAIKQLGSSSGNLTFEEAKEWLKEVGYQHADEFMKKIAYRWDEWEEEDD